MKQAIKERPILMNGEMVRATRDGRKTQTRRVLKRQPDGVTVAGVPQAYTIDKNSDDWILDIKCPFGQPGDRLYVRETWGESEHGCEYRADWSLEEDQCCRYFHWKPSIHMPRRACRTILEIVSVRVERVQEISEEDAKAEGAYFMCDHCQCDLDSVLGNESHYNCDGFDTTESYRIGFHDLWDSINAKRGYGWDNNPFVWVVEYEVVEGER